MNKVLAATMAIAGIGLAAPATLNAQINASDSVMQHAKGNRLSVGGYGEVALSRNFYSDRPQRFQKPQVAKQDPSHGRFDIPHAVIYLTHIAAIKLS